MTHAEAIELIRQGGNSVKLLVKRCTHLPGILSKFHNKNFKIVFTFLNVIINGVRVSNITVILYSKI